MNGQKNEQKIRIIEVIYNVSLILLKRKKLNV